MTDIHIFKLLKVESPYSIQDKPDITSLIPPKWVMDESEESNSEKFNKQVKYNRALLALIEGTCKQTPLPTTLLLNYETSASLNFESYDYKAVCQQYLTDIRNRFDVLSRDHDVFTLLNRRPIHENNIDIHVILASKDESYVGHVYAWISPVDPSFCMMIGIQSAPQMPFLRMMGNGVANVSNILINGVITFATSQGASKIVVLSPIGAMLTIVKKEGFVRSDIKSGSQKADKIIGYGGDLTRDITDWVGSCNNCYVKLL